ncbi:MAG: GNAT family N-acetyltransferase [Anaerolineae bacterium]|nr:GNAT family N-acetyltransferase [Anaerolineae bacterium]
MPDYTITFRPYTAVDLPFIQAVYASSREVEMAIVPWTEEEKSRFLEMQCRAQLHHYEAHYQGAEHLIILKDAESVGRLYVHRTAQEIRLMDITLLPAYRRQSIGSQIIGDLLRESEQSNRSVTLHVELINPDAYRLYERLGFTAVSQQGIHIFMERQPQPTAVPH